MQFILAKIALLLGVKIHVPVFFREILEPDVEAGRGWHVTVEPSDHLLSDVDFDVIVGANGQNRCLPDFRRTKTKGRTAIAVTANFVNRRTTAETRVRETGALNYVYDREFFLKMREEGVELENIVYFKGETHYFVMTVKRESLLQRGVLKDVE